MIEIPIEALTQENFAPFGRALSLPCAPAPKVGAGWRCWIPVDEIHVQAPMGFGIVETTATDGLVPEMERHVTREEFLIAASGDIVQTVCPPAALDDPSALPDARRARAFLLRPGMAIIMAAGTWHYAALPVTDRAVYYFAIESRPDPHGDAPNPWRRFQGEEIVRIVRS
jgi:ureidoglycolate hydrolase